MVRFKIPVVASATTTFNPINPYKEVLPNSPANQGCASAVGSCTPLFSRSSCKAFCASVTYERKRQGLIFFSNISSSSAGVRLEMSGMMKTEPMHNGALIPAKKNMVLRPQLAALAFSWAMLAKINVHVLGTNHVGHAG